MFQYFHMGDKVNPSRYCKSILNHAKENGNNVVIIDTAGRLHIDEELMDELKRYKSKCKSK